jgi:hypothetical protein
VTRHGLSALWIMGVIACSGSGDQALADLNRAWSAPPVDSITIDVSRTSQISDPVELAAFDLDSVLGARLKAAPYRIRIVEGGFVAVLVDDDRVVRFDSLGNRVAEVTTAGVADLRSAGICVRNDSALIVDGAGLYNQPRRLVWLALSDTRERTPDTVTVNLPPGTLDAGCISIGARWVLILTIPETPGDLTSRLTTHLIEAVPGRGVRDLPLFALTDRSEQLRGADGRALMNPSPWAAPPLLGADGMGRLFVIGGPTGVVRIIDTAAMGARVRGITPTGRVLEQTMIDSVAADWREREISAAGLGGQPSADDIAAVDRVANAIRGATPGGPVPEVDRLLVGTDGFFAVSTSEWLSAGGARWDLIDPAGAHIGALKLRATSRGVGVQGGTLWYVDAVADSAPRLVRVRPAAPTAQPF